MSHFCGWDKGCAHRARQGKPRRLGLAPTWPRPQTQHNTAAQPRSPSHRHHPSTRSQNGRSCRCTRQVARVRARCTSCSRRSRRTAKGVRQGSTVGAGSSSQLKPSGKDPLFEPHPDAGLLVQRRLPALVTAGAEALATRGVVVDAPTDVALLWERAGGGGQEWSGAGLATPGGRQPACTCLHALALLQIVAAPAGARAGERRQRLLALPGQFQEDRPQPAPPESRAHMQAVHSQLESYALQFGTSLSHCTGRGRGRAQGTPRSQSRFSASRYPRG